MSVAEVARRLGVTQQKLSRRMTGQKPFDVDELDEICTAAGVSFGYVVTGVKAVPDNDGGGPGDGTVRPKGFEPLTSCAGGATAADDSVTHVDFSKQDKVA